MATGQIKTNKTTYIIDGDTFEPIDEGARAEIALLKEDIDEANETVDYHSTKLFDKEVTSSGMELFNVSNIPVGSRIHISLDVLANIVAYVAFLSPSGAQLEYYGRVSYGVKEYNFEIDVTVPLGYSRAVIRTDTTSYENIKLVVYGNQFDILNHKMDTSKDSTDEAISGVETRLTGLTNMTSVDIFDGTVTSGAAVFYITDVSVGDTVEIQLTITDNSVTYVEYLSFSGSRLAIYGRTSAGVSQKQFDEITTIPEGFYKALVRTNSSDTTKISLKAYLKSYDQTSKDLSDLYDILGLKEFDIKNGKAVLNSGATNFKYLDSYNNFEFTPDLEKISSGIYIDGANLTKGKKYLISFNVESSDKINNFEIRSRAGKHIGKGSISIKAIYEPTANLPLTFYAYVVSQTTIAIRNLVVCEIQNPYGHMLDNSLAAKVRGLRYEPYPVDSMTEEMSALSEKISKVKTQNTVVCALVSDTHYDEKVKDTSLYSQEMRLAELFGVDFFIHLGDLCNEPAITGDTSGDINFNRRRFDDVMEAYRNSYVPFLYVIGHHEMYPYNGITNDYSTYAFDQKHVMGLGNVYGRNIKMTKQVDGYSYYFDFEDQKIRFIALDSVSYTAIGFSPKVVTWTRDTALASLPNGYKVVFFAHCPTDSSLIEDNPNVENGELMENVINNFISNGGNVLGYFHGHTHFDNIAKRGNIIEVATTTEQDVIRTTMNGDMSGCPIKYLNRNWFDKTVFSMDFLVFDSETDIVDLYRFGVGNDRQITKDIAPVDAHISVGESINLSNYIKPFNGEDTVTWESANTSVATVANGTVTGVSIGEVFIYVRGLHNDAMCKVIVQ